MKILLLNFTFLIFVDILAENIFLQTDPLNFSDLNSNDTVNTNAQKVEVATEDKILWANSLYISSGFGIPQGLRFELGYNWKIISLAATFGIYDKWSGDPAEGTLGFIGKIHFPQIQTASPYILIGLGGTISIFGESDNYTLFHLGSKINLSNWLQLCPEFGFIFTSKHISGGRGLFGSSPEIRETTARIGFNVSFEIDF